MSRLVSAALLAAAVASVVPTAAFAEPDPPRPFCSLHFRDRTLASGGSGVPDITYPEPYWIC